MKKILLIISGILAFVLTGFSKGNVQIFCQVQNGNGEKVSVTSTAMNNWEDTLTLATLDKKGQAVLELSIAEPRFISINIGKKAGTSYVTPGDDIILETDLKEEKSVFLFKGKGAEANNYLVQANSVFNKYFIYKGEQINFLNSEDFAVHLDTMEKALADFHKEFTSKHSLDKATGELLALSIRMIPFYFKQNHIGSRFSTWKDREKVPESLKKTFGDIPLNDQLLKTKYREYHYVLMNYYYDLVLSITAGKTQEEIRQLLGSFPKLTDEKIKQGNYSIPITEYLQALNIYDGIKNYGLASIDSLFTNFKSLFPSSAYLPLIENVYTVALGISKGKPAPDISGTTPDGKQLSISDLKGKVIYMDVWATWCGPCRAEFPKAKELHKHFEKDADVVFLYVSVDSKMSEWKDFLFKNPSLKGTHINSSYESMRKAYQLAGVPKYVLIDKGGHIVSVNAPRPSSDKIEGEIRALLK